MQDDKSLIVPFFKAIAVPQPAASKEAGRPIFKDMEVVEVRIAGDRNFAPTFPAHAPWKRDENGEDVTYAERFPEAYARFAEGREQVADGTPLSELPFLTESKRATLRSLKVYTAEALASIDGKKLNSLGPDAREMKDAATAYLTTAAGTAGTWALTAEIEALKAQMAEMTGVAQASKGEPDDANEKESIKAQINELTGSRPRGNPSVETLREMLADMKQVA